MLDPSDVLGKNIGDGEGSDTRVEGIRVLNTAGPCVLDDVKDEFAHLLFGGADDAVVGQIVCPIFLSLQ